MVLKAGGAEVIRRPRSPSPPSWLYKKQFHSVQMLLGPAHPAAQGLLTSECAPAFSACQRLHFLAEGLSLPTGPVLPTPALSASPLGHSHAESRSRGSVHTCPQSSSQGPEPRSPPVVNDLITPLGLASSGSWLWSLITSPHPSPQMNLTHANP